MGTPIRRRYGATIATCVALVIAGCSSSTETSSETNTSALNKIDPAAFQAVVTDAVEDLKVPGAIVSVRTPDGDVTAAVGTTELGTETKPTVDTHFRIASNTKTMTAALIVLLAQDGKLDFADPISKYVADVPDGDNITVAELLKMRSGLYGFTNAPEFAAALDADPGKVFTPQEILAIAFARPAEFAPDAEYDYSNTNYALLALVAEKVGGQPLADQFQERLFGPLGMKNTLLPASTDRSMPEPYSHGYMYGETKYAMVDEPYPADLEASARSGTLQPVDYTNQNPSYATGAGGAISTAADLQTWITALVSGDVFDADYRQQWLDSVQVEDPSNPDGQKYGYGISYQRFSPDAAMFYHGGELPGFNSFMGYDPDNDVTLVIWTNLTLSPDGKTTAQALLPLVLDEIYASLSLVPAPTPSPTK